MTGNSLHETVLKNEAISVLNITPGGVIIDVTFGRGGHSKAILKQLGTEGRLIAVDRDPEAIAEAIEKVGGKSYIVRADEGTIIN